MTKLNYEEAVARILELQGYLISGVTPKGLTRGDVSKELMTLKRSLPKRKKDAKKS